MRRLALASLLLLAAWVAPAAEGAVHEIVARCGDQLCSMRSDGSGRRQITTDGSAAAPYASPAFNAAGTRLAFRQGTRVFVADPASGARVEVAPGQINRGITISAGGATVAVAQERLPLSPWPVIVSSNWVKLWRANGTGTPWGENEGGVTSGWLGERAIMDESLGSRRALCLWQGAGGCERWVARDSGRDLWAPDGSPDGRLVAAAAGDPGTNGSVIALYDAAGGALVRDLTAGPADTEPEFSPDGAEVVFERGGQVMLVPVGGGTPRLVGEGASPTFGARLADSDQRTPGSRQSPAPFKSVRLVSTRPRRRQGITVRIAGLQRTAKITVTLRRGSRRVTTRTTYCNRPGCSIAIRSTRRRLLPVGGYTVSVRVDDAVHVGTATLRVTVRR